MSAPRRFLMVTFNAAGNWPPELALLRCLVERGHHVRVVSDPSHAAQITAVGGEYEPFRHAAPADVTLRHRDDQPEIARILRDVLLNPIYADELFAAVARETPDVLLVDQMLFMAAVAAERTGVPTALLWHTVYAAGEHRLHSGGPMTDAINAFRARHDLAPVATLGAAVARADAILAFTPRSFDAPSDTAPPQLSWVGPLACLPQEHPAYPLPWPEDDARPLVVVGYSTSFQDQVGTLQRVADAVADLPARVLLTLGAAIAASELRLPANVTAERFVPHAAVLPRADLVVTHAGHGTVMAAVTAGVPMVCTPMGRDQHEVAACVERCGLGRVLPMTASPAELRTAIAATLADDALRATARRFAAQLDLDAGKRRAVERLEALAGRGRP